MVKQTQVALSDAAEWLGDFHPLAAQLGSADGLVTLATVTSLLRLKPVADSRSLCDCLRRYQSEIMVPLELPAIQTAYGHATRNELRELISLDQQFAENPVFQNFAPASRRVGQGQLQKLRPLRDQRIVQRYLHAVETSQATGWHILVYGLTMAIYSLPLRQGLLGYAHQTMRGFIYSAAHMLRLAECDCRELFDELCANLPAAVDTLVVGQLAV